MFANAETAAAVRASRRGSNRRSPRPGSAQPETPLPPVDARRYKLGVGINRLCVQLAHVWCVCAVGLVTLKCRRGRTLQAMPSSVATSETLSRRRRLHTARRLQRRKLRRLRVRSRSWTKPRPGARRLLSQWAVTRRPSTCTQATVCTTNKLGMSRRTRLHTPQGFQGTLHISQQLRARRTRASSMRGSLILQYQYAAGDTEELGQANLLAWEWC